MKNKSLFIYLIVILAFTGYFYQKKYVVIPFLINLANSVDDDELSWLSRARGRQFEVIDYINNTTDPTSTFLVFRQSDFGLYAQRKWVRNLDPRLVTFYKQKDIKTAYKILTDLGINYIYLTSYPHPTVYNSMISSIISDPTIATLEYEAGDYRLFKLFPTPIDLVTSPVLPANVLAKQEWSLLTDQFQQTIKKGTLAHIPASSDGLERIFYSDTGPLSFSPYFSFNPKRKLQPNTIYRFSAKIKGYGLCNVHLAEYDARGKKVKFSKIWSGYLSNTSFRKIYGSAKSTATTNEYRLVFNFPDKEEVLLKEVSFDMIGTVADFAVKSEPVELSMSKIYANDFNAPQSVTLADVGWSTYSANRTVTWPSGIHKTDDNNHVIFLSQPDHKQYWLYTGQGKISDSPIRNLANSWLTVQKENRKYRISFRARGHGQVVLYAISYNKEGDMTYNHLGLYSLPPKFKELHQSFELPDQAIGYRIAFYMSHKNERLAELQLDDFKVETPNDKLVPASN